MVDRGDRFLRIYHLDFLAHAKGEFIATELYRVQAFVRAECPFESLFFLSFHLQESDLVSCGQEQISIASTALIETYLPKVSRADLNINSNPLWFNIGTLPLAAEELAESA